MSFTAGMDQTRMAGQHMASSPMPVFLHTGCFALPQQHVQMNADVRGLHHAGGQCHAHPRYGFCSQSGGAHELPGLEAGDCHGFQGQPFLPSEGQQPAFGAVLFGGFSGRRLNTCPVLLTPYHNRATGHLRC